MPIFESAVSFLGSPTGVLLYYLVLLFTLEAAIGLCWGEWRRSRNTRYRHFALGFGGLLVAKLLVAAGKGLSLLGLLPDPTFLALFPPLSSAIETAAVVLLCWAFLPSEFKVRRSRYGFLWGSLILTVGLYLVTAALWAIGAGEPGPYARHWLGRLWFAWQALLFVGLFVAYVWQAGRRRALIAAGFAILALGRLLELVALYPPTISPAGPTLWEHVANLIALPLFTVVIYQVIVTRLYRYNRELQSLSQESQSQVRDLFFLLETVKSTTASLDAQVTYNQVVENIALAMRADHCALALHTPDDPRHLHLVAAYDVQARERLTQDFPVDLTRQKVLEVAVKRNRQVMIEQLETDPQLKAFYLHLRGVGAGSALFQPITIGNRVLGVVLLAKETDRIFTVEERTFCKNLTKQIAVALENVQVFAASKRQMQQAIDLRDVTQSLGSSLDLKQTLDTVLLLAQRQIGYDMAEISLLDENERVTWIRGARERVYGRSDVGKPLPAGPASWIAEHGRPLLIAQVTEPPPARPEWADVPVASFLGAPIQRDETLLGVIELARGRGAPFTEEHLQFLVRLTDVAAEALERALTYQTVSQHLERSQSKVRALHAAYAAIQPPNPLDAALGTILDEALRATGSTCGTLVVLSEQEEEGLVHQLFRGLTPAREELWRRLGVAGSGLARTIRQGEPMRIPDVTTVPEFRPLAEDGRVQLIVPLPANPGPGGGLIVESTHVDAYSPADLRLVQALANVAALAIVRDRLQKQAGTLDSRVDEHVGKRINELDQANQLLQRQQAQAQHLLTIKQNLTSSLDLTVSLTQALPLVLDVVNPPFSGATVLLFDVEMNSLVPQVTVGYRARPFKLDEDLAWQVMAQRQVIQVAEPDGSAVALPLLVAQEFLGVLLLAAPGRRHFDRDELTYLATITGDIAQTVSNSRLHHGLEQQVERLAEMLQARAEQGDTEQLRPILDSMPVGVLVADPGGFVALHNELAQRILEPNDDLVGQNIHTLCGLTGAEGELNPEAIPLLDFQPVRQRLELKQRVLEVYLAPTLSADGALLGYLAVLRDTSEEARRTRLRGEFLSTLSRQLYGPLTSISGYQDLVLEGDAGPLTDTAREYLQVAQDNCARLTRLLDSLMDLTGLERGTLPVETLPVELHQVVTPVLEEHRAALDSNQVRLQVRIPDDLPSVQANPQRLAQVLGYLLANAIEYSEPGGHVEIAAHVRDGLVQVNVVDTGMGIAPEDQDNIFTQFFRTTEAERRRAGGTGLSLALSKVLIELQGGQIWMHSDGQPGHGSTFSFTLPVSSTVGKAVQGAELRVGITHTPRRILVVDDEPDIARLVAHYLEQESYEVEQAQDGPTALDMARRDRPDLILLDLAMPEMDGYTVIQELRADPVTATIPVVVMSVLPASASKTRLGAVDYVNKPLNRQQLLAVVSAALVRVDQILIVSRDETLPAMLAELLSARGYRVLVARDNRQARGYTNREDPRLVLLDKRAAGDPGSVGDAFLDWLRLRVDSSPTVVLVDEDDRGQEEHWLVHGANTVVVNPAQPTALADRLESLAVVASYYRDLVQATGEDDPYLRWRAMEALSQAPTDEVLGYLLAALRDQNPYVRLNAVDVLGRLDDTRAMLPLIGCLTDVDPQVVGRAAEVLGKLSDPRSVEPLIAHMKNSKALVRSKVVEALGILGDQRAVSSLMDTLADGDMRVRWSAVHALGQLGSANVIEALLQALRDEDAGVRGRAAAALGMVAGRGEADLGLETSNQVIEGLIAVLGDPAVDVRERAAEALGIVGDERAIFPLRRLVTEPSHESGTMLPELARLAIRQIRERSRTRGPQWSSTVGKKSTASK